MALIPLIIIIVFVVMIIIASIFAFAFIKKYSGVVPQDDILKQLQNYQNLLKNGFITQEEFEEKKRELLSSRKR